MNRNYVTAKDIAFEFKISLRTVYSMMRGFYVKQGKRYNYFEPFPDPCGRIGNRYYFNINDVNAYFQRCGKWSLRNGKYVRR